MMDMLCEFMRIVRIHCGVRWFVVVVFGYGDIYIYRWIQMVV